LIPAKLSSYEWSLLSPSRRDYVRLGLLNYSPPTEYSPVLETEDGWLIAVERERHAAKMTKLDRHASHNSKAIELVEQTSNDGTVMVNINKSGSCIKNGLTRILWHEIKRLVTYVVCSHPL
jgi:hypothetical protein